MLRLFAPHLVQFADTMAFFRLPELPSRNERLTSIVAFFFLLTLMVAHSMLETVRDALFLGGLPAERLPYVYLLIVGASLVLSRWLAPLLGRFKPHIVLSAWLLLSGGVTALFWSLLAHGSAFGLYALYVWSSLVATLALLQFWTMLGDILSLKTAKRVYAFVGAGSAVGAIIGSGLAGGISMFIDARHLLLVVAAILVVSAIGPLLLAKWNSDRLQSPDPEAKSESLGAAAKKSLTNPYTRLIAALVAVTAITVTLGDYVFKASVAEMAPTEELGAIFGAAYFGFNIVGLLVQVLAVNTIIRRFTLTSSLGILPALILMGGTAFVVGGGAVAAFALRGADGALRHSLHRTAVELLYVPMSHSARRRLKLLNDLLTGRAAQAIASLIILTATALGASLEVLGFVLATFAAGWLMVAVWMRRPYLDLFRQKLDPDALSALDYPELDVDSLESLLAGLNDENDHKVIAVMDLLTREGLVKTIPALIIYHPSEMVALHAVDIFTEHDRQDLLPVATRRLADAAPLLRASLIAATAKLSANQDHLVALCEDPAPGVRLTAGVFMVRHGWGDRPALMASIRKELGGGQTSCSLAFLRAVQHAGGQGFESELLGLLELQDVDVRRRTLKEMLRLRDPVFLPALLTELTKRETRRTAAKTLFDWGPDAMEILLTSLEDRDLDPVVRRQLPRTIAQFPGHLVVQRLAGNLHDETDGMVRYRTIAQLDHLQRRDGALGIRKELREVTRDLLVHVLELADWRATLQRFAREQPDEVTWTHEILERLISDKEDNATDLIVRVLVLLYPGEEMTPIARGLRSKDESLRSSALELLEYMLPADLRTPILAILADRSPHVRLQAADPWYSPRTLSHRELLQLLIEGRSFMLRSLATRLAGEMRITELRKYLDQPEDTSPDYALVAQRALESLDGASELASPGP